jgi:phospholipid N-methyltransferase
MTAFEYMGQELDLFALADNWRNYWVNQTTAYIGPEVLEVGAGCGSVTRLMLSKVIAVERWMALEPDPVLAKALASSLHSERSGSKVCVEVDTIAGLDDERMFDSILYIDVIEHIEDHRAELRRASKHLKSGGYLIILVPAHQRLYSPFDKSVGHYRRYDRHQLRAVLPDDVDLVLDRYLDSIGLLLSLANRLLLRQSLPTSWQIHFWDKAIVPCSRVMDRLLGHNLGKSLLVVAKKHT